MYNILILVIPRLFLNKFFAWQLRLIAQITAAKELQQQFGTEIVSY